MKNLIKNLHIYFHVLKYDSLFTKKAMITLKFIHNHLIVWVFYQSISEDHVTWQWHHLWLYQLAVGTYFFLFQLLETSENIILHIWAQFNHKPLAQCALLLTW